jgi:uncharacterized membrane-anchored protein
MRLASRFPEPLAAKVPEITVMFWVVKILTTGMGEATSDWLAGASVALAGAVGLVGLVVALWLQLRTRTYQPWVYWFAVMMVAVFGTMAADGLHKILGLPYAASTAFYAVVVSVVLVVWHRVEGTLSIHSIVTRRRELFYWLTVLATFALGTAVGDLTAIPLDLGYFSSGVVFAVAIVVPLVAGRLGLNAVVAFWTAYVLTRPLGASFADWLGKPHSKAGGVGWGDGTVAALSTLAIVALVAWVVRTGHGVQPVQERSRRLAQETSV